MRNVPFNAECQSRDCNGNFVAIENYEYKEHEATGEKPWIITYKCSHKITAYQCDKCGRIHGKVKLSTGEIIEFFEGITSKINFVTPSNIASGSAVSNWNPTEKANKAIPAY
ncbi:MAG: hypothetical protein GF317_20495 [Candidatus Lokiarchaeota archaeon]|nr:hypothetical protein [Candidatus Lokiarchaeota archaeon]